MCQLLKQWPQPSYVYSTQRERTYEDACTELPEHRRYLQETLTHLTPQLCRNQDDGKLEDEPDDCF